EVLGDAVVQPEPSQPRGGQHDAVDFAFVDFAQARGHVAAQGNQFEAGVDAPQQRTATQAPGAEPRAFGQLAEQRGAVGGPHHERVARVFARRRAGDLESRRGDGGEILHAVHGEVDGTFEELFFDRLDEQPLAADFVQLAILDAVTFGGDDLELDLEVL